MLVTIKPVYRLHGMASIPGDSRLTAILMAVAACSGGHLVIDNIPDDPAIGKFAQTLISWGCNISMDTGTISVSGSALVPEITITQDIPTSVVHIVAAGAAASGSRVIVPQGMVDNNVYDKLTGNFLTESGLQCTIDVNDDVGIISNAAFSCENRLTINSMKHMEALVACIAVTGGDAVVISTPDRLAWPVKIASVFGIEMNNAADRAQTNDFEITRRLARANGEQPPEMVHLSRTGLPVERVHVPGDTRLAAAVTGLASILQRSDVTVTDVLWEQGRRGFFDSLRRMKGAVTVSAHKGRNHFESSDVAITWQPLERIDVTPRQASGLTDELLTLAAVATNAEGETVISDTDDGWGIGRDACKICARGFETLGVDVGDYADGIVLRGRKELIGGALTTGGIENVALALSLAAFTASGSVTLTDMNIDNYILETFLRIVSKCAGV